MSVKVRAEFDITWSGQKRAYADTTTEATLTVTHNTWMDKETFKPMDVSDEQAKKLLSGFAGFTEVNDAVSPFDPILRTFQKTSPGVWYILIACRYND